MLAPALSPRFFNTTGPCQPGDHYMIPAAARLPELRRLVAERRYFVLHAARQTGKTTAVRAFAEELRAEGTVALHASLETSRQTPDLAQAEPRWLQAIYDASRRGLAPGDWAPPVAPVLAGPAGSRLATYLADWAMAVHPRLLVLFLDEVDSIEGEAMVSFLAQLRSGFHDRPKAFPSSVTLVGLRDLKDYLVAAKGGMPPNPGSPFNIKAASLTLSSFAREELCALYGQHTTDTGQPFTDAAIDHVFHWSGGQPFLVNALGYFVTRQAPVPAPSPIDAPDIDRAKEHLVLSRTTHLDNLAYRLHEPRVAGVIRPILLGEGEIVEQQRDDIDYCFDLGLIRRGPDGLEPANPIYREVLARSLALSVEDRLPEPRWPWKRPDGSLDFPALVDAFFAFWRENGEILFDRSSDNWREAAAHIAFMAFVHRVVNGGGTVLREYATGRGAMDLLVQYGPSRHAVELKRVRAKYDTVEGVIERGTTQLLRYLNTLGLDEGWLLVFDLRFERPWEERLYTREIERGGKRIHVRGG